MLPNGTIGKETSRLFADHHEKHALFGRAWTEEDIPAVPALDPAEAAGLE